MCIPSKLENPTRFPHIYVHLPFCESICHYCDFYVARTREANHPRLFAALEKDLQRYSEFLPATLSTIYFGGGTPSESPPALIVDFLGKLGARISRETEIVLEANPTSITKEALYSWKSAGITRLSIGVQSLRDPLLKRLSRLHDRAEALRAVEKAVAILPNVNADLIYGVPGLQIQELREDADTLAKAGVKHISAYTLTLETSHFLFPKLPSSDETMDQSEALREALASHGFSYYEASNYARPGFESRHNQAYWQSKPYLALGPSAHGYDGKNLRWKNISSWQGYSEALETGKDPVDSLEQLSEKERQTEYLITRLRTLQGLDFNDFEHIFGHDLLKSKLTVFEALEKAGLGMQSGGVWHPSFKGLMLADEVSLRLA